MPSGYVVRDANGQTLVYVYSRESEAEALQAKVLTADEARRIAINVAKLPGYSGAMAIDALWVWLHGNQHSSRPVQAASPRLDQLWIGLRRCLAILSRIAADEWSSLSSAHLTHLAAKRSHVTLLSGDRVNLAIARHSPANFLNSSDGFILVILPVSDKFSYPTCARFHRVACAGMIAPT